jgi:hypothetical protein
VPVTVTYLTELAEVTRRPDAGAAVARTISADANTQLGATAFSSTVTSHLGIPIAVERTMRWDADRLRHAHREGASRAGPRLVSSPRARRASTTRSSCSPTRPRPQRRHVRFLLENGTEVTRDVPALAVAPDGLRGDIPELVNQSFGTGDVHLAGAPERAMYFGTPTSTAATSRPA